MATLQNTIQYRVYFEEFTLNFQHAFFQGGYENNCEILWKSHTSIWVQRGPKSNCLYFLNCFQTWVLKEISLKISSNGNLNYTVIFIYFFYYIGANTYISSTIKTHQQIRGKNLTGLFSQFIVGLWQYVLLDQTWGGNRVVNMRWEWPSFKLPTRSKGRRRRIGITWNIDQIVKIAANNFVIYYIYFLLRRVV